MVEDMKDIIQLPADLFSREQYKLMNPMDKERYVYKTLKRILELNTNGVMISAIVKATGFSHATVWHHLEKMTATRESYKLNYGTAQVYFANGKMVHHLNKSDLRIGNKEYSFYIVENNFGTFLYVQERKEERLGAVNVCGGLLIPKSGIRDFVEKIQILEKNLEEKKNATIEN